MKSLLCSLKPERASPGWSFLQAARSRLGEQYTEIGIDPLSAEHSKRLLATLLDVHGLPDDVRDLVLQKSEGNPFFLEEVLRSLAAYDLLLVKRRRAIHRRTAEALEALHPERGDEIAALLAYHYRRAEVWEPATTYSRRAGERAVRLYALKEAYDHYWHAVDGAMRLEAADPRRLMDVVLGKGMQSERIRIQESLAFARFSAGNEHALAEMETALADEYASAFISQMLGEAKALWSHLAAWRSPPQPTVPVVARRSPSGAEALPA